MRASLSVCFWPSPFSCAYSFISYSVIQVIKANAVKTLTKPFMIWLIKQYLLNGSVFNPADDRVLGRARWSVVPFALLPDGLTHRPVITDCNYSWATQLLNNNYTEPVGFGGRHFLALSIHLFVLGRRGEWFLIPTPHARMLWSLSEPPAGLIWVPHQDLQFDFGSYS